MPTPGITFQRSNGARLPGPAQNHKQQWLLFQLFQSLFSEAGPLRAAPGCFCAGEGDILGLQPPGFNSPSLALAAPCYISLLGVSHYTAALELQ